ncbi:MAG: ribonuclease III [Clostridiales bacterium]|nr:ribonuclease III [Clostridiales bacterium]
MDERLLMRHLGEALTGGLREADGNCDGTADPSLVPPLVLAYVGDAVYEVFVRTRLALGGDATVHKLHVAATRYARSASQAGVVHSLRGILTERESDIVRRGRNAHSGYVPKNANVAEYRYATGFEALLGYLYLSGQLPRLLEILARAADQVERVSPDAGGSTAAEPTDEGRDLL